MSTTPVVTIFLRHAGAVALVQRSSRVGTYQGRWSGISGYLEGDPAEHFRVELAEETALTPEDYTLLRQAAPVLVTDEATHKLWEVHPFLCEVHDPSRIRLDWENRELRWVAPEEIRQYPTVPGLWEVYVQVSELAVSDAIERGVGRVAHDKTSGARQLALAGLDFLADLCRTTSAARADVLMGDLTAAAEGLREARPTMAVLDTTLALVLDDIPVYDEIRAARTGIGAIIDRHRTELACAVELSIAHLEETIPEGARILTHSYSSSIERALALLRRKRCTLTVTESRPGGEGRRTASLAAAEGLAVRLIADAAVCQALATIDIVLLGADAITPEGGVINKTGSASIACCAQAVGVPVYVLAEKRKIARLDRILRLEEGDPAELWDAPPPGITVEHIVFERVAPERIRGIILEEGICTPEEIYRKTL